MRAQELFEEKVSVDKLETSPRIVKDVMVGWYAVVQGFKVWKSNIATVEEAKEVIKTYDAIIANHPPLRIIFVVA
jgi:hypothetical protein